MSKSKAQLSLVFISIVWGLSFLVLSDGVEFLAPETLLFWRFLTSAAVLFLIKKVTKNKKKLPWKEGLIAGVLFAVGYLSQTQGILYTSPSVAALLT
ncbi:MAG: EamA family transporter, partial [Bacillota bacterium]